MNRCEWANSGPLELKYHDEEWGVPVHDDRLLFEMLILEGAQSGLSWSTILKKRESYLEAFDDFDAEKISKYSEVKIEELMNNAGIVRHKLKINAAIANAKSFLEIQKEYGTFDQYIWSFVNGHPVINKWAVLSDVPVSTAESLEMSKSLKKKGFKFIGATTCYAYMQAVGMVNDHLIPCFRYSEV
ncbi:DNA-3-methyladenine glycosylase I [Maridesulfovibrio ferrireducens]|uniref:DNA-3-methyladenine glycosylase I n=1 Tax=Maridesulfovibrio ferrireducens TaxID=246191 RepID=UPI001A3035A8|nr:DNA-3-methyladenine glycosylase I [Maridesulfovibrio ferrireducens]MBI9111623.1 DNA-3-methyladenine glycosylase I [Maridesulfovibrio ferrireducens]